MSKVELLKKRAEKAAAEKQYIKDLSATKENRDSYTQNFLSARLSPSVKVDAFLVKACKALGIKPSSKRFNNTANIQRKLGFPEIPKKSRNETYGFAEYIDAKFGPYTLSHLLKHEKGKTLIAYFPEYQKAKRQSFAQRSGLPSTPSGHSEPIASRSPSSKKRLRYVTPGAAPLVVVPAIVSRPERRKRGALPFSVRTGQTLTPEQHRMYKAERSKARRRFKMNIVDRLKSFQREYDYLEAIKVGLKMFSIPKKYWKLFIAHFDATARTESGYNPMALARLTRSGKVKGPERGMFQLFTKYYLGRGGGGVRGSIERRRRVPRVNYDALGGVTMPRVRAEHLSLFHQTIAHMYQYIASWRLSRRDIQMEEIFDKILNARSDTMKRQWAYMLYLRHYRGLGGSRIYRTLLLKGILFPTNSADANAYYDKYLHGKTWQGRRKNGRSEFRTVVKQTTSNYRYVGRFLKNLRELEGVDLDRLLKTT